MFPILQIGPLAIQTPGLALLLGLWLGLYFSERYAMRRNIDPNLISNFTLVVLAAGIFGARLGYVVYYPEIFSSNPINLLSINPGLFDPWSGVAVGLVSALIYGRRKRLPLWGTLDILTPAFAVLAIASSLSNLASGNGYGAPTRMPWGIWLWGAFRHPTQIYELLAHLLILWLIWPEKRLGKKSNPGNHFLFFLGLTAATRLVLEAFRGDSIFIPGGIRLVQIIAWLLLALCLWLIGKRLTIPAPTEH